MNHLAHVVVVGSVNVDMIVRVERLPHPGETVAGGEFVTAGGGKGANQAVAARRLGAEVALVARIGQDSPGDGVLRSFAAEGLGPEWISRDPTAPTGVALIFVDRAAQNMIAVASGANLHLSPAEIQAAVAAFRPGGVLLTQLEIPLESVRAALELARERGLTAVLNPAPARDLPDDLLHLADWVTPNEFEAAALTGVDVRDDASAHAAAVRLLERGARHVVLTLGERGAYYASREGSYAVPAFAVPTVDSTAAGDAFTAGLAVAIGRGRPVDEALRYANACGALATTRSGAQPSLPRESDVDALLARQARRDSERP